MDSNSIKFVLAAGAALALGGCSRADKDESQQSRATANDLASSHTSAEPIASAESAAPASIAHDADVMVAAANGGMKTLRAGRNGWTCMPDDPSTPGNDPMCLDHNALKWATAWVGHTSPPDDQPGVAYMLQGGTDPSNTDPFATKPASAAGWIKTGPHLMIVGSKAVLAGYPAEATPDTSAPYVMWAGTSYAHLMVPVQ